MIGIRLKEADSEASRCQDINFYRKKHRRFELTATLTYVNDDSENLNGRGYRCCLFMLVISMAVAFSVGIQVVLITMINHLRA